ncbi:MAG: alanine racemase [Candidatus Nanopelagicales bacterium]|nr:alanine racemase [Candidatus Nanopelagicales bacterium]
MMRAVAEIDLDALEHNLRVVREAAPGSMLLAVVKADAYGHGLVPIAQAARAAGADWLGVALLSEAVALRESGDDGPLLAWLWTPGDPDLLACVTARVQISVSSLWALIAVVEAAAEAGVVARVHLKLDTGLSRNGSDIEAWHELVTAAAALKARGRIEVVGIWSHLADAASGDAASVAQQRTLFLQGVAQAREAGIEPQLLHLANSAAALTWPDTRFDLVRIGIAMYGVSPMEPASAQRFGLRAVMTLRARLALVKTIPAGQSVSYGGLWTAVEPTRVGLVPLGYADGIPRIGRGAHVLVGGVRCAVLGQIAMDQFVIELPAELESVEAGDEVIVFGDAATGAPTADDWGTWSGSIGYEIVTRLGARVPRAYERRA